MRSNSGCNSDQSSEARQHLRSDWLRHLAQLSQQGHLRFVDPAHGRGWNRGHSADLHRLPNQLREQQEL